ncbi:MAG: PTS sugar transporter subunit IIC, partial [Clostridia bacterium]|nr:PTS sugar transporter subunit IIC [Clostridia bacterium]
MKKESNRYAFVRKIEQAAPVRAVRNGLINIIPVLIIGAFALILKTFPVDAYQNAIAAFAGGFFLELLNLVYSATFGALSVYMTFSISRSYMKLKADREVVNGGAIVASLISFFILSGAYLDAATGDHIDQLANGLENADPNFIDALKNAGLGLFNTGSLGPKSMFLAIITGILASRLYLFLFRYFFNRRHYLFSAGADREFNRMLSTIFPIGITACVFALFNLAVVNVFDVSSFRELLVHFFNWIFSHGENGFFKGFFFVLLSSILWFFGIHGSDALESVMQTYFTPGLAINQAAISYGGNGHPTEVLT